MRLSRSQCETVAILAAPFCMVDSNTQSPGGYYDHHPGSTLAALAQTCRAVSQAALKELWRTIPSLGCFACVLPRDLWMVIPRDTYDDDSDIDDDGDDDERREYYSFVRDAVSADFERLRAYTPYIECIDNAVDWAHLTSSIQFDSAAWAVLAGHLGPHDFPLLTRLANEETLLYAYTTPFHQLQLHHFIGAPLRRITAHTDFFLNSRYIEVDPIADLDDRPQERHHAHLDHIYVLLRHVAVHCPRITHFAVSISERSESMTDAISDAISALVHLVGCYVLGNIVRPRALRHLAWLSTLRDLSVGMDPQEYPQGIGVALGTHNDASDASKPFAALQDLSIRTDTCHLCTDFLRHVHSPHIRVLSVRINAPVSANDISPLLMALSTHPSGAALAFRDLTLWLGASNQARRAPTLPPGSFLPLCTPPFRKLRCIEIHGFSHGGLDDAALEAMARAWPHVRVAKLLPGPDPRPEGRAGMVRGSLSAFSFFAAHCPHIRQLGFALEDITPDAVNAAYRVCTKRLRARFLREIDVGPSAIAWVQIQMTAALLSLWLFNLRRINAYDFGMDINWIMVLRSLPHYRRVRRMERRWIRDAQNVDLRQITGPE